MNYKRKNKMKSNKEYREFERNVKKLSYRQQSAIEMYVAQISPNNTRLCSTKVLHQLWEKYKKDNKKEAWEKISEEYKKFDKYHENSDSDEIKSLIKPYFTGRTLVRKNSNIINFFSKVFKVDVSYVLYGEEEFYRSNAFKKQNDMLGNFNALKPKQRKALLDLTLRLAMAQEFDRLNLVEDEYII